MKKLAIITTHPIQYYAPVFRLLAESKKIIVKVFYTWGEASIKKYDQGFGKMIEWYIPLLTGYEYEFMLNTAKNPGSHHFNGIKNPHIIKKIKLFDPDAILVYGWAYHSHLKVMRYFRNKVPVWFRGDSTLLDDKLGFKTLLRTIFLRWVYAHVDKAFYVGKENKKYFLKYGLKEHQLYFAPHAIDNERFGQNRLTEAKVLRDKLNLRETDILILFAGKLEAKKDPVLLLEAFLRINAPHVHLLFIGNGILEKKLKLYVLHPESNKRVHFYDFKNQRELPVYYQACNLLCLPSLSETWGLAVNEAMACGKAILVSDKVGCATDLVQEHINGSIFMSGNLESLTDNLQYLLDKDRLISYGQASKKIILNWNFHKIADTFIDQLTDEKKR